MNKFIATGLTLSTIFIGAAQAQAGTISRFTIDNFDQEFTNVEVELNFLDTGKKTNQETSPLNQDILGNFRTIFVEAEKTASAGGNSKGVVAQTGVSSGLFNVDNDSGIQGLTTVTYDANGSGLSLDLLNSQTNAFSLDVINIDLNTELTFTVEGGSGEATLSRNNLDPGDKPIFEYEEFDLTGDSFANIFANVTSISFTASGPPAFDATFDNLEAIQTGVPESSSVFSLIGLATLAAGAGLKNKVGKKS